MKIDLWQGKRLISSPRDWSGQGIEEGLCSVDLGIGQPPAQERRPIEVEKIRVGEDGEPWEVPLLLIVAEEEEEPILDDGSADCAAELMTDVFWFDPNL